MNVSFLNPGFLLALPVILVPLIIHLLTRKKAVNLPFSTIRFIRMASTRVVRTFKLKQLILLILRTLILLFLTLLFARPMFELTPSVASAKDSSLSTVLIMDNSYSMGYVKDNVERFSLAKDAAKRIVRMMGKNDRTALLLVSDTLVPSLRSLTLDRQMIIEEIEKGKLSFRPSDLSPAMAEAYSILKPSLSPNKEIIVITDAALNGWSKTGQALMSDFDRRVKLIIVDIGDSSFSNVSVTGQGRYDVTAFEPLKINSEIENHGSQNLSDVPVSLSVDGKKTEQAFLDVPGRENKNRDFSFAFSEGRVHTGLLSLREDSLACDDNFCFKVNVREKTRVLCIDGAPGFSSLNSETFYLNLALSPQDKTAPVVPLVITQEQMKDYELTDFSVVVAANVKSFSQDEANRLFHYVKNGGGMIVFCGDNVDRSSYNDLLGNLIPARLGVVKNAASGLTMGFQDKDHPILKVFSDPAQGDLTLVRFYKWFELQPYEDSRVILGLASEAKGGRGVKGEEGEILLLEGDLPFSSSGRVLLFASSADREWTNFPAKPVYLPLVQEMVKYLSVRTVTAGYKDSLLVGEVFRMGFKPSLLPSAFDVTSPDGKSRRVTPVSTENFTGMEFSEVDLPGVYRVNYAGKGRAEAECFVANVDTKSGESDLTKISRADIRKKFPSASVFLIDGAEKLEKELMGLMHGREASRGFAFLVIAMLLAESFIANIGKKS